MHGWDFLPPSQFNTPLLEIPASAARLFWINPVTRSPELTLLPCTWRLPPVTSFLSSAVPNMLTSSSINLPEAGLSLPVKLSSFFCLLFHQQTSTVAACMSSGSTHLLATYSPATPVSLLKPNFVILVLFSGSHWPLPRVDFLPLLYIR